MLKTEKMLKTDGKAGGQIIFWGPQYTTFIYFEAQGVHKFDNLPGKIRVKA